VLADNPDLAAEVTRAYFATLQDFLNDPDKFQRAAARDASKPADVAARMLAGIKFAALDDNLADWLPAGSPTPGLAESAESIGKILADHGQPVALPGGDPMGILYAQTLAGIGKNRAGIPELISAGYRSAAYYPPLSGEEWTALSKKMRGTLLDEPITFRPGSTEVGEEFQDVLRAAAPKLAHYPAYRIVVEAHVTPSDQPGADHALSKQRADAVKRFLVWECRVPEDRVLAIGAGGSDPPPVIAGEGSRAWERRTRRARIMLVGD